MSEPSVPPPPPPSYTPPPPPSGPSPVSSNRTLMIILSYLGPLALVPLLAEKDDREVQWHAKNGLVICVAEIILWVAISIIGMVMPDLGCSGCILGFALCIAAIVVAILGITKGLNGQRLIIPGVSDFANKF